MLARMRNPLALPAAAILLIVILSLALAACSVSTTRTYTNGQYGYSFEYPADWVLTEEDTATSGVGADPTSAVQVGDPEGTMVDGIGLDGLIVRVYELGMSVDEESLPAVKAELQTMIDGLLGQDPSSQLVEPLTSTTVAGVPGYRVTYTFDWDSEHTVKSTAYYLFDGPLQYELVTQAATGDWAVEQTAFSSFVSSFEPGTAPATATD